MLGLNGAEIVYNPSATVAGLSQYLWKLEQPAHAAANGYFMGCINRVGKKNHGTLVNFMAHLILLIHADKFLHRHQKIKMNYWLQNLIWI